SSSQSAFIQKHSKLKAEPRKIAGMKKRKGKMNRWQTGYRKENRRGLRTSLLVCSLSPRLFFSWTEPLNIPLRSGFVFSAPWTASLSIQNKT
uniref:Uncharacterized protein n=1 Tax=Neolamprologus brichardi TaxID=32507 RepID=A0A3Q4GKZ1_NEOBR